MGEFLAACVEDAPGEHIASRELHEVFTAWCGENGARPLSAVHFGRMLSEKGRTVIVRKGRRLWRDMRLRADAPAAMIASGAQSWRDDA